MYSSLSIAVILTLSPSRAPPVRGEDGSIASRAVLIPFDDQSINILSIKQDFPTPGAPVMAIDDHLSCSDIVKIEGNLALICLSVKLRFSKPLNTRAIARLSPFIASVTSSKSKLSPLMLKIPSTILHSAQLQHRLFHMLLL